VSFWPKQERKKDVASEKRTRKRSLIKKSKEINLKKEQKCPIRRKESIIAHLIQIMIIV